MNHTKIYVLAGLIVGFVLGYAASAAIQPREAVDIIKTAPSLSIEQRSGKAPLGEEEKKAVAYHKDAIVRRAASSLPLTVAEKNIIGSILIGGVPGYSFTRGELTMIDEKLK